MAEQKKIKPLTGVELIHKVKELGDLSKPKKAKVCGYYSLTKNGLERVNMKQFLNALINAEGIELDGTGKANGQSGSSSASYPIIVQSNESMDDNKIIAVKRANPTLAKPQLLSQRVQQSEPEPVQQPEIEQPEQPDPVGHLESLIEPTRDESVYGSGWNLAQLMNEFSERVQG